VERAGAEFLVLCTNTMHKVAPQIEASVGIPLLHIADATAGRVKAAGLRRIGLLGTRFTMEEDFYRGRLEERHGLEVLVPGAEERETVHRVIYEELCRGRVRDESRQEFRRIVRGLVAQGATGVILGCTEIGLLLRSEDATVPLFDTARIHAEEAARYALACAEEDALPPERVASPDALMGCLAGHQLTAAIETDRQAERRR
jgi:aspartate racemase